MKLVLQFLLITILIPNLGFTQADYDKIIEKERRSLQVKGTAVAVIDSSGVVYEQYFGKDVNSNSLFIIGSMSKSFTALAILKACEDGFLNLDDPISKYLSYDSSIVKFENPILVKHLLHHTSGISRESGLYFPYEKEMISEYIERIKDKIEFISEPGSKYEYSNLNYILLGQILESATEKPYQEFVKKEILAPFGMHNTKLSYDASKDKLVHSYQYLFWFPLLKYKKSYSDIVVPAGYIASTLDDMCKYLQIIRNSYEAYGDSLVSKFILENLFEVPCNIDSEYAGGWFIRKRKGFPEIFHDGLTQSFVSSMAIYPEKKQAYVVLNNLNSPRAANQMLFNLVRYTNGETLRNYQMRSFIFRNSLPLFALYVFIVFVIRLVRWIRQGAVLHVKRTWSAVYWMLMGVAFGVAWLIVIPKWFSTPFAAIIDFEPNSGISLLVLSISIICNSILRFITQPAT